MVSFYALAPLCGNRFGDQGAVFGGIFEQSSLGTDTDLHPDGFAGGWIGDLFGDQIRVEAAAGFAVGVADVVAYLWPFAGQFTDLRHKIGIMDLLRKYLF